MRQEKDIVDLPLITAKQAGMIFGWSGRKFKLNFAQVLHEEIASARQTARGRRYLLTHVLRSAFPEANNHAIHMMALEFNLRQAAERKIIYGRKANSERGKDKDGVD